MIQKTDFQSPSPVSDLPTHESYNCGDLVLVISTVAGGAFGAAIGAALRSDVH